MAITIPADTTEDVPTGVSQTTVTLPSSVQGDIICFVGASDANLFSGGIASGQGWTDIDRPNDGSPGANVAYKEMGASPDTTVNVDQVAADRTACCFQVIRGVDLTTPLDGVTPTIATGASGMPNPASITTGTDNALVMPCGFLDDDELTATAPAGYGDVTALGVVQGSAMMASLVKATAGAEDPGAFGGAGTDAWRAVTISWREAAVGGGLSVPVAMANYRRHHQAGL